MANGGAGGTEVARFYAILGADTSGFTQGVTHARSQWSQFATALAGGLGIGVGFGLVTQGVRMLTDQMADATQGVISYEMAFTGVRKTVDASDAEFKRLDENIRALAKSGPVARDELAEIMTVAGQLGVRGVDNLTKFTDTVAKIAIATDLTSRQAAFHFARVANIMGEPISKVDQFAAGVVGLGNTMGTTESNIADYAERIAGAGRIAGLSTGQIYALSAAFGSIVPEAEAGGTAVQQALLTINNAVVKGGDELKVFALTSGMSVEAFRKAWGEDAYGAFTTFMRGLGESGASGTQILDAVGLGGVRSGRALLAMGGSVELLDKAMREYGRGAAGAAALTNEYDKYVATTANRLKIFENNVRELKDEFGRLAVRLLNDVIPALTRAVQLMGSPELSFTEKVSVGARDMLRNLFPVFRGIPQDDLDRRARTAGMVGAPTSVEEAEARANGLTASDLARVNEGLKDAAPAAGGLSKELQSLIDAMGTSTTKVDDLARAWESVNDRMFADLADAWVTGGDARVAILKREQEELTTRIQNLATHFHETFGVAMPDAVMLADNALRKITETALEAAKKMAAAAYEMQRAMFNVYGGNMSPGAAAAIGSMMAAEAAGMGGGWRTQMDPKTGRPTGGIERGPITVQVNGLVTDPIGTGKAVAEALNKAAGATGPLLSSRVVQ